MERIKLHFKNMICVSWCCITFQLIVVKFIVIKAWKKGILLGITQNSSQIWISSLEIPLSLSCNMEIVVHRYKIKKK